MDKASVGSASLLALKAEILRKQEEIRAAKLAGRPVKSIKPLKKPDILSHQNVGVSGRAQKDLEAKLEEDDALGKSRRQLEAKSKLYEQLRSHGLDDNAPKSFLVDFEKKAIDDAIQKRIEVRKAELEKAEEGKYEERSGLDASEQDWVDYVDSLGRTRHCLRHDLEHMQKMDRNISNKTSETVGDKVAESSSQSADLMSTDMIRQKIREKWEAEELEALNEPVGPVHYANVQYNEVRSHGVAYYQFAKSEAQRQEQMEQLQQLRQQTLGARQKQEAVKKKRKALMKARLKKVKQRRILQTSEPTNETSSSSSAEDSDEDIIGPRPSEQAEPELLTRDESIRKNAVIREWDLGKQELFDDDSWKIKLRDDRLDEFAPPSFYYKEDKKAKASPSKKNTNPPEEGKTEEVTDRVTEFLQEMKTSASVNSGLGIEQTSSEWNPTEREYMGHYSVQPEDQQVHPGPVYPEHHPMYRKHHTTQSEHHPGDFQQLNPYPLNYFNYPCPPPHGPPFPPPPQFFYPGPSPFLPPQSFSQWSELPCVSHYGAGSSQDYGAGMGVSRSDTTTEHTSKEGVVPVVDYGQDVAPGDGQANLNSLHSQPGVLGQNNTSQRTNSAHHIEPNAPQTGSLAPNSAPNTPQPTLNASQPTPNAPQPTPNAPQPAPNAPQPAHFTSAPVRLTAEARSLPRATYERVNLYELPLQLPAPISEQNIPTYPSQEGVQGTVSEEQAAKNWLKHYGSNKGYGSGRTGGAPPGAGGVPVRKTGSGPGGRAQTGEGFTGPGQQYDGAPKDDSMRNTTGHLGNIKDPKIPFVSPYVQKKS